MNATDDWYDVTRLTDRSYRIDEGGDYGMFLIEGEERSILVDAAAGVGDLYGLVTALVETPITLVLTHTHWDHIGAASQFDDVRVSPAELPSDGRVTLDSLTDEFLERPARFVERWLDHGYELPDGVDPEAYEIEPADATALSVDEPIDLGDRTLEVVPLPGHSPGQIGLLDPATETLYGGDVIHYEYNLYIMFEDCDLDAYIESLERVRMLRDDGAFETLATSHNDPLSGDELTIVDDLLEGLREIAAGEREYEVVETDYGPARSYQIGRSKVLTATEL
jgi:glyoxylase-like metal-dependent hydrolase (beta-lactamase superfamily II)